MAEPSSKAEGQTPIETTAARPSDSPQLNEAEAGMAQTQTEDKQTMEEPTAQSSAAAATETEAASKGKEKDESTPQAGKPREGDSLSIEPTELPPPAVTASSTESPPVCTITLLLPTGARHPYKLDEKYLAKRNVEMPDVTESGRRDPFSISVYKLKELILREWREEWEGKPASPSSIRLIHFGKLLDDKEQLKKYQFSQDSPNVVHMSVRPPEMMEEEETGKASSASRHGRSRDGTSNCCVIL
ncbi:ubiquitin-related domain-containing protein [Chaetomium strumarium]|uniref:Ubiquitin-related domain-containing protein n=1 Tax=Chaetomium strumarium TaxID=1170767 RepID=A0AAJ0GX00_9PEZI|nr:ubiquitin-related domain-containing protein [Chaetomium strumarium]